MVKICCENMKNKIPEISCSVFVTLNENLNVIEFLQKLKTIGYENCSVCKHKHDSNVSVKIIKTDYQQTWEIEDVIKNVFSLIEDSKRMLTSIVEQFSGEMCVNIAVNQYGTNPEFSVSKESLIKLCQLKAAFSIDIC